MSNQLHPISQVDVQEVTNLVAQDSEKKGLYEDAIKLYDLAKVSRGDLFSRNQIAKCRVQFALMNILLFL